MISTSSCMESMAITMAVIMQALLLQKPSKTSLVKDHKLYFEKQLELWKQGKIGDLLREGKIIQRRLIQSKARAQCADLVFVRLLLQGKVFAAIHLIGSQTSKRLEVNDDILTTLQEKYNKHYYIVLLNNLLLIPTVGG